MMRSSSNTEGTTEAPRVSIESLGAAEKEGSDTSATILVVDDDTVARGALDCLVTEGSTRQSAVSTVERRCPS